MCNKSHTESQDSSRGPEIGPLLVGSDYWYAWCRFAAAALGGLYGITMPREIAEPEAIKWSADAADAMLLELQARTYKGEL